MILTHMKQRIGYEFLDFLAIQKLIFVGVIFFEDKIYSLLYFFLRVAKLMIFIVSLVLHESTIHTVEVMLVFTERRARFS